MQKDLTFITGSTDKAEQLSGYLGFPVKHKKIDLVEIQSLDLEKVIEYKLKEAYALVKSPVIVDDVSLVINGMGRLPGPLIKFFLKEVKNEGLCKINSLYADKAAKGEVGIGYYDGREVKFFMGEIEGRIADEPKGEYGFGWDAIFIPNGYEITRGEMDKDDYDATSPRKFALEKLEEYFRALKMGL